MNKQTSDPRHIVSRRALIGGSVGAALLVACGGGGSDEPAPSPAGTSSAPAGSGTPSAAVRLIPLKPTELGAPAVPAATAANISTAVPFDGAVAPYAKYGTDANAGAFPRSVRHAMGEARLPKNPQRVVVLDTGEMDATIELGLKPMGTIDWTGAGVPPYLQSSLQGVKIVGSIQEPDIEGIVALAPDLILTNKQRHEKIYDRLNAIAPAVFGERAGVTWRYNFELYARALGREAEGAKTIAKYEARAKELNGKLPKTRPSISIVRVTDSVLRYYQRANFPASVLTDLGFPRPPAQNVDDFALNNQGLETIGASAPADVIVLSIIGSTGNQFARQVQDNPLWKNLQAVKDGKVLVVDDNTWIAGLGYKAADGIMDDIAKYFKV